MKINNLLESITPASSPENATNSAPTMGRSDKFLEDEQLEETSAGATGSGSVASVSSPVGGMQRRGKGSMFAGIKTSSKFPNSQAVKEAQLDEVDPRNFDSDEDYYAARNAPAKARSHSRPSPGVNQDDEAYFREIFRKKRLAAQQQERNADHDRLATGTNESVGSDMQVWDVHVFNNFYRGKYADYGPRLYSVVASSPEEARQVVINNPDYVLQDLLSRKLQNGKKVLPRGSALPVEEKRVGKAQPGTITTMALKKMLTPDGVQSFKFTNGKIVDGSHVAGGEVEEARANTSGARAGLAKRKTTVPLTPEEQAAKDAAKFEKWKAKNQKPVKTVDEASFDYTTKDLGNDYAGFPSNHNMKHKFLAKIKPEKQQLYKDKINNTHEWDDLFALFNVAKQRGDIISQGDSHRTMGLDASLEQHADDKMKELGHKFKPVAEGDNPEYDDESGSAESNLHTIARAAQGLIDTIGENENLPEWAQEKIAKVEGMLVAVWDYLESQEEQGIDPQVDEDWQKTNKQDKTDGMSPKAVKAYRRENPGSKLKTAVTKKPSELKAGSKDAKRRKSFCARMSGNKGPMKDEKGRPTPKAKALSRWNCESVEQTVQMLESVQRDLSEVKQRLDPKCWKGYKKQGTKMKGGTRVNNCVPVSEAEFNEDKLAQDLYKDLQIFKKGADKEIGSKAKDKEISSKAKDKEIIAKVTNK